MMQTALSMAINLQHHMIIKNCNMLIPSGNVEKYVKEVIEACMFDRPYISYT